MKIQRFHTYLVDLGLSFGSEPGKVRPVVVVQTDLLNEKGHSTTIVCLVTSKVNFNSDILRVHLTSPKTGLNITSDVMVDQIRAIDNGRFKKHLGFLSSNETQRIIENLGILIIE